MLQGSLLVVLVLSPRIGGFGHGDLKLYIRGQLLFRLFVDLLSDHLGSRFIAFRNDFVQNRVVKSPFEQVLLCPAECAEVRYQNGMRTILGSVKLARDSFHPNSIGMPMHPPAGTVIVPDVVGSIECELSS